MITLGLYLLADSHRRTHDRKRWTSFGALQRRGLDAPPRVAPPQPSGAGFTKPCTFIFARSLPTPARFRPLGPPMFDSPTIAS